MPLPLILGIGAAVAGVAGVGSGIHGAIKMKDAKDTMELTKKYHEENIRYFEEQNGITTKQMDTLGEKELEVLRSFDRFTKIFEKIHNKPEFATYKKADFSLPQYDIQTIKEVSVGAGVLLGGIGGAAAGTAGGFAASGATTAAVMALGTASTGTAISSLSGAAATNAALAALGGGALAAGGGGMALGTTILGASTLGVGLMVGGIIFNIVGGSVSGKADEAYREVQKEREKVNEICEYLSELNKTAKDYLLSISNVYNVYQEKLNILDYIVNTLGKEDWWDFTKEEQTVTENTVLLVNLLYQMAKVQLVLKAADDSQINAINKREINQSMRNAKALLSSLELDWNKIKETIRINVSDESYYRWIESLKIELSGETIRIIAPYKEAAKIVKENYREVIEFAIKKQLGRQVQVVYGFIGK